MVMLNHLPTDCRLLPAMFHDLMFGIKFIFSSKIEKTDGGEVLNSSHGCSTHDSFPFFAYFHLQI
jgi:hypothetical protein